MKLIELLQNVDRTKAGISAVPDIDEMLNTFGITDSGNFNYTKFFEDDLVKLWYVMPIYDTDSYVGLAVLYYGDTLIGMTQQGGRKCSEDMQFVGSWQYHQLKDYLLTLVWEEEDKIPLLTAKEPYKEEGDTFNVNWTSELMVDRGIWKGQQVKVRREPSKEYLNKSVRVFVRPGVSYVVPITEVDLLFKVLED